MKSLNGLYVPTKAAWYPAFQQELLTFPVGKNDDIVDALAYVGMMLPQMQTGRRREPKRRTRYDPATDAYRSFRSDWEMNTYLSQGPVGVDEGPFVLFDKAL
jgi:hypothetical protein